MVANVTMDSRFIFDSFGDSLLKRPFKLILVGITKNEKGSTVNCLIIKVEEQGLVIKDKNTGILGHIQQNELFTAVDTFDQI